MEKKQTKKKQLCWCVCVFNAEFRKGSATEQGS